MSKDIVVITKKESTNGVYHPYGPVSVGFKIKAKENSELFKKFMWDKSHIDSCTKLSKDKGTDVGKTTMSMIDCV